MQLLFQCVGWPDQVMVRRRLEGVPGLGKLAFAPDGRMLMIAPTGAAAAAEADLRLRELGWRAR